MSKRERKRTKITRHHRKPRFFGGKSTRENILRAPENQHNAFHTLFAWGYPALMVAQVLNAKWLAHETVLVPIPMTLLRSVLRFLRGKNYSLREEDLGITEAHRALLHTKK